MTGPAMAAPERAERFDQVDRLADRLAALDDVDRAIARRVVLRLVQFGERAGASRRQPAAALRAHEDPARFTAVLQTLCDAGRLRIDDDGAGAPLVALAAERSPQAWPELADWLATHGRAEQLRRELESDAAQWRARAGHRDVGLLDPGRLRELPTWLTAEIERDLGVSDVARSYISASRAAARRRWWPGRGSAGGLLAVLLILLFLATPIILLFIVVLTASVIHRFG